jgi:hypothetical protein
MAAIERSAYPRFASRLSTRELVRHFRGEDTKRNLKHDWID